MRTANPFFLSVACVGLALLASSCSVPEKAAYQQSYQTKSVVKKSVEVSGFESQLSVDDEAAMLLRKGIEEQRNAGHPNYNPRYAYVVVPAQQEMKVLSVALMQPVLTIPVGTGKNGLGFGGAQTPIGFFTMGGVRIAKGASAYIQTGDSKTGVSGVYAEMLYPPSHGNSKLRGRVPNNVIIHGFNPSVSSMLRERHSKKMIGRIPCTTGCPVPGMKDLPKLAPYLVESAGKFDPTANPNSKLRSLIRSGQVVEHSTNGKLGDPILILNRPFRR